MSPKKPLSGSDTPSEKIPAGFRHGALCPDLVRRLARSQARGWRQEMLINELLGGTVEQFIETHPAGYMQQGQHVVYGTARVVGPSFRNLRKRLVAVGFVVRKDRQYVDLFFPEAG